MGVVKEFVDQVLDGMAEQPNGPPSPRRNAPTRTAGKHGISECRGRNCETMSRCRHKISLERSSAIRPKLMSDECNHSSTTGTKSKPDCARSPAENMFSSAHPRRATFVVTLDASAVGWVIDIGELAAQSARASVARRIETNLTGNRAVTRTSPRRCKMCPQQLRRPSFPEPRLDGMSLKT
jgi:hypothetical protein